ncbi:hypothetical protein K9L97_05395 [Candidatus Woesearchaeota archaeon]|nr:hypothetical protein [Candidatus Woesearchaeota archaeon]
MNIAEIAYKGIFPTYSEYRNIEVQYSNKFKSLNANVKYDFNTIIFSLSKDWLEYSEDLRIGLIQHLLLKVYPNRKSSKTTELDLYEKFINNLGKFTKIEDSDEELIESFNRVNEIYFDGFMDVPNLKWGGRAFTKLGHYEYQSNLVVISDIFKDEKELLDYIMYHELLHKKHGYKKTKSGRAMHHTKEFLEDEKKFKVKDIEQKLKWFIRKKRLKKAFLGF